MQSRQLYQGLYRNELEDDITQSDDSTVVNADNSTTSDDGLSPEEITFKQRYGALRSHSLSQNERIKSLESQLSAAQKQEIKFPSTQAELQHFAQQYPDVFRHIRSIAMTELLTERENISLETKQVKDDLETVKRERGMQKILSAHPDFEALGALPEFKEWIAVQPAQIQDWLFETPDPDLCIKAIDLFKVETGFKAKRGPGRPPKQGADVAVTTRGNNNIELVTEGGKKIWKASEIGKLAASQFIKLESEIENARAEGRIDMTA